MTKQLATLVDGPCGDARHRCASGVRAGMRATPVDTPCGDARLVDAVLASGPGAANS